MANSSYKNCDKGHFYPASLNKCPFCKDATDDTVKHETSENSDEKTVILGENNDKTQPIETPGKEEKTHIMNPQQEIPEGDKTMIFSSKENEGKKESQKTYHRKLVGWLVSYTLNENGVDFRLYEGQNTLGRDPQCTIRIVEDTTLSSKHATILYRNGGIYFRDEMATNPSFVNGEEVMPGNTVKLKDGDKIQIGDTLFLLRFALI